MMEKISIHALTARDREAWGALWQGYLTFYETTLSQEIYDFTFARLIDADLKDCAGFLAFDGDHATGQAVGLVHCLYHLHMWQRGQICYLQDLYVASTHRNQGIARKLITEIYAHADSRGAEGVYWNTQDFNHTARKLYDKVGVKTPFIKYKRG